MFGYVCIYKPELKMKHYEAYKAVYCGMCKELGKQFGPFSRLFLNYDFVFLGLLIDALDGTSPQMEAGRCLLNPLQKRPVCTSSMGASYSAKMGCLFFYYKILDNIEDSTAIKRLGWRIARIVSLPFYKKVQKGLTLQDQNIAGYMARLRAIQAEKSDVLDEPALLFGNVLAEVGAATMQNEAGRRIAAEILKNVGRWIYILDAFEDIAEDEKTGNYNPLFFRFGKEEGEGAAQFASRVRNAVDFTLTQSLAAAGDAFNLADSGLFHPVVENILYLGLRAKQRQILFPEGENENYGSI